MGRKFRLVIWSGVSILEVVALGSCTYGAKILLVELRPDHGGFDIVLDISFTGKAT
jgi:hypothetical protein